MLVFVLLCTSFVLCSFVIIVNKEKSAGFSSDALRLLVFVDLSHVCWPAVCEYGIS